jgi:hypothetical protein
VKVRRRGFRYFLTGLMNYGKEVIDSSPTSQIADKLPNPNRCERVGDAEPITAKDD